MATPEEQEAVEVQAFGILKKLLVWLDKVLDGKAGIKLGELPIKLYTDAD